jgi:hypothetical protein
MSCFTGIIICTRVYPMLNSSCTWHHVIVIMNAVKIWYLEQRYLEYHGYVEVIRIGPMHLFLKCFKSLGYLGMLLKSHQVWDN